MSAVNKADVLETYADLYDVFEDNKAICKELDEIYDRLNTLPSAQPEPCEDAVSRQVAIDTLLKWMRPICINNNGEVVESDDMVAIRRILKSVPPVQPEPKWIPCSEVLPEEAEDILICDIDGDIYLGHRTRYGEYYADFCSDRIKNVVAWMPRPKPYKEEEE